MMAWNNVRADSVGGGRLGSFWIPAVVVTVVLHLGLLVFSEGGRNGGAAQVQKFKKVILLPADGSLSARKHRLFQWIEHGNPALISKPDMKYGYSAVCSASGFRAPEPDIPFLETLISSSRQETEGFQSVFDGSGTAEEAVSRAWNYSPAPPSSTLAGLKKKTPPEHPLCRMDGKVLDGVFKKPQEIKVLVDGAKPGKSTVLRLSFEQGEFFPRAKTISSCGLPALDRKASEALIAFFSTAEKRMGGSETFTAEIEWRKENGK